MDIILTGIARSGTTLTCTLLNQGPQCVALHEPMAPGNFRSLPTESIASEIKQFFASQRATLLAEGRALSKSREGRIPTNPFHAQRAEREELRTSIVSQGWVHFDKKLIGNFRLAIKHPNFFTALLPILRLHFPCYAVVRNPLAALLSWQTITAPIQQGRLPFAEAFSPSLTAQMANEEDRIARQILALDWYFKLYGTLLPRQHVIRYEDIIKSAGSVLSVIDPDASQLRQPLDNRNRNPLYDRSLLRPLGERLLSHPDHHFRQFYGDADIEALMAGS